MDMAAILNRLCPMHVLLDASGQVVQAGPTLDKLGVGRPEGQRFLDLFEVYRPRAVTDMAQLLQTEGRKLHLRLRRGSRGQLKGVLAADGTGGAVVNLSFGIGVIDAVRDYALTGNDFAPTDLAIEMLYLMEAKSAAMDASRRLNIRLKGAMVTAEQQAFTDTLTGLRNRRALDHMLNHLSRSEEPFCLMHLDLDFFKQVNDTYGHAAGDYVLQCVARQMLEATRKGDLVARFGGDEFVLILPGVHVRDRIAYLAGRLIQQIEKPVLHEGRECRVSASIGISFGHGATSPAETVLAQADSALYAAKHAGRGQFRFYDPAGSSAAHAPACGEMRK